MRSRQSLPLLMALSLALMIATPLSGCSSTPTATESAKEIRLTILHTNDSNGYVDPCG